MDSSTNSVIILNVNEEEVSNTGSVVITNRNKKNENFTPEFLSFFQKKNPVHQNTRIYPSLN